MNRPPDHSLPDDGMIHEWLDGQLDADTSARFDALVQQSPAFAARVAEARGLVAASSRILSALDDVPAGVLPRRDALPSVATAESSVRSITQARPRGPTFAWQRWASAAAVLLVAVSSTMLLQRSPADGTRPVGTDSASQRPDAVTDVATTLATPAASGVSPATEPLGAAEASIASTTTPPPARPSTPAPRSAARSAPEPDAANALATREIAESAVAADVIADAARASAPEAAKAMPMDARVRGGITSDVQRRAMRSEENAPAPALAPAAASMARSLGAVSDAPTERAEMPGSLRQDEVQFAVQRVECSAQCRQLRVEIARDGRLRRWSVLLGRSAAPDTGHLPPAALAQLNALADSLSLDALPAVVPLMGAQCRTVGALRESLRLEFRTAGALRAVTALPWCDAPQHPLAIMARAIERAVAQQLGAPSP